MLLFFQGGPKSSFLTEEKRARLKTNPVKVRFAEEVLVNGHAQVSGAQVHCVLGRNRQCWAGSEQLGATEWLHPHCAPRALPCVCIPSSGPSWVHGPLGDGGRCWHLHRDLLTLADEELV